MKFNIDGAEITEILDDLSVLLRDKIIERWEEETQRELGEIGRRCGAEYDGG